LGPFAVGTAVDAVGYSTRLAWHRFASGAHSPHAGDATLETVLVNQMPAANPSSAAGVRDRLFGEHGAIYAHAVAGCRPIRYPHHRSGGIKQRWQYASASGTGAGPAGAYRPHLCACGGPLPARR